GGQLLLGGAGARRDRRLHPPVRRGVNEVGPGAWLRLTALAAALATGAAVVSGVLRLGTGHEALAALALPPLVALVVAARVALGDPAPGRLALTLLGLALACGGASALNHVLDRDIDRLMGARTRARPVAAQRMPPSHALEFGLALSAASFVLLAGVVNLLAAVLALAGNLFYVLVYTGLLKRRTPQNIVIGGAAGAVPPLVGWAAATGRLTLLAFVLFAILFLWTPPHFWALALLL